ncbi:Heavy metal-associated isoprenylated plant protein 46 [Linum grandiflorum]
MKQKVVIKVTMNTPKLRAKAMKVVVGVNGVDSASLAGPDKTQIEVTGDGVDSVELVSLLRKKVGFAELVTVAAVEEKKKEDPKPKPAEVWPSPAASVWSYGYANGYGAPYYQIKAVIKLPTVKCLKSRSKAMKIAVGVYGVNSVAWTLPEKTQIEVTGEGVDPVVLVNLLRKKFGSAELDAVSPVEEKKEEEKKEEKKKPPAEVCPSPYGYPCCSPAVWPYGCYCCPPCYVH